MDAYEAPLIRYAHRFLDDQDLARDVVQDTFLRLCRVAPETVHDHLAQWLYTVCRHRAFEVLRKDKRMHPLLDTHLAVQPADGDGPAAALSDSDDRRTAADLLQALPDRQQEVIRLKFHDGLSYREISAVTGLTETNVGYLIHQGIKAMRRQFAELNTATTVQKVQP
jgi:RNA polymerase sigma-70 factor (ECF subfamily)